MPQGRILLKSISNSQKVAVLKTDGARLLYTWLLAHVDVNGCYYADPDIIKGRVFTKLRKSVKAIQGYLDDLQAGQEPLIRVFAVNGEQYLWLTTFVEKQPSLNPQKEGKPYINDFTPELVQSKSGISPPKVKESKVKESKVNKGFTPPTFEEVESYIKQNGYSVDPVKFYAYFTESDPPWTDSNGKPVRSWKQKVITWSGGRGEKQQSPQVCIVCRAKGDKYQLRKDGEKVWLCKSCRTAFGGGSWANMPPSQVERIVEEGKKRPPPKEKPKELVQADKVREQREKLSGTMTP